MIVRKKKRKEFVTDTTVETHTHQSAQNINQQILQQPQQQTLPSPNILSRPKCVTCIPQRFANPSSATGSSRPTPEQEQTERASVALANMGPDPRTYAEAMACSDATEWEIACEDKKHAFECMGVYEVVPRLKDHKVVGSKWVFCIKQGPDGQILKYKA